MYRQNEAERIGAKLLSQGWPKNGADAAAMKAEVVAAQAAVSHGVWLKGVESVANGLRLLVRAKYMPPDKQRAAIMDLIGRIK